MRTTDFTKFPIGTKVWSFLYGWGEINKIDENDDLLKVFVIFNDDNYSCKNSWYCFDGRECEDNYYPSLFLNEFIIPESANVSTYKVDQKIMISSDNEHWIKRYFSHWNNNDCYFFVNGADSWSSMCGETEKALFHRLPTVEELSDN